MNEQAVLEEFNESAIGKLFSECHPDKWISPEMLQNNEIFPFGEEPSGFISYSMNFSGPLFRKTGIDLWELGKVQQRASEGHVIPYKTEYEVMAGFWIWYRKIKGFGTE